MIRTLVDAGVTTCFTNPGTSEMHFVAALDTVPEMRGVLGLFEGVATGAADGYARMAGGRRARCCTSGPGSATGWPTCTTPGGRRRRSSTSSATTPRTTPASTPRWQSDIETVGAQRVAAGSAGRSAPPTCAGSTAEAVAAATGPPGQVATLILPADVSWSDGADAGRARSPRRARAPVDAEAVEQVGQGAARPASRCALLLGGTALRRGAARWPRPASPPAPAPGCSPRRSSPAPSAAPASRAVEKLAVLRRDGRSSSSPGCATSCSSTPARRCRSSPTRASRATSCPRLRGARAAPARRRRGRRASRALADAVGADAAAADRRRPARRGRRAR